MSRRKEEWRDIPGYDGFYQVSDWGRVRSFRKNYSHQAEMRTDTPTILKPSLLIPTSGERGTVCVGLRKNGKRKTISVARLVAITWLGGIPDGMMAFHRNGDPTDNYRWNIELKTPGDKSAKAYTGHRKAVLKIDLSLEIVECYPSARRAARAEGLSPTSVWDYCNLVRKRTIIAPTGFIYAWDDEVCLNKTLERAREELDAKEIRYNDPHTARYYDLPQEFEMDMFSVSWAEAPPTQAVSI